MRLEYFQMIDTVVSFDATAGTIHCRAFVPEQSPIFEGHFPGYPILPGVLLIETMAQAAGYVLLGMNGITRMPFFAGVKKAKFRKFIQPGTTLDVYATLVHEGSGYAVVEGRLEQDGPVCDAELTMRILDFPAPELEAMIRDRAAQIGLGTAQAAS
jgi:3-hydroxyacyl-[acyl-carrier-protein] dehydratase